MTNTATLKLNKKNILSYENKLLKWNKNHYKKNNIAQCIYNSFVPLVLPEILITLCFSHHKVIFPELGISIYNIEWGLTIGRVKKQNLTSMRTIRCIYNLLKYFETHFKNPATACPGSIYFS